MEPWRVVDVNYGGVEAKKIEGTWTNPRKTNSKIKVKSRISVLKGKKEGFRTRLSINRNTALGCCMPVLDNLDAERKTQISFLTLIYRPRLKNGDPDFTEEEEDEELLRLVDTRAPPLPRNPFIQ
jgi:hypothetical protein